jgi:hypothetical protein
MMIRYAWHFLPLVVLLINANNKKLNSMHACARPPAGNLQPTISSMHAYPLMVPSGGYQILPTKHVQQLKCVAGNAHTSGSHHQRTCVRHNPDKNNFFGFYRLYCLLNWRFLIVIQCFFSCIFVRLGFLVHYLDFFY